MRLITKVTTSTPFAVCLSLGIIVAVLGAVTGKHLPFGVAAGAQGAAMLLATTITVAAIRRSQNRNRSGH